MPRKKVRPSFIDVAVKMAKMLREFDPRDAERALAAAGAILDSEAAAAEAVEREGVKR